MTVFSKRQTRLTAMHIGVLAVLTLLAGVVASGLVAAHRAALEHGFAGVSTDYTLAVSDRAFAHQVAEKKRDTPGWKHQPLRAPCPDVSLPGFHACSSSSAALLVAPVQARRLITSAQSRAPPAADATRAV